MSDLLRILGVLGIDRLVLGIHDSCFPSDADEDTGRGSPYSRGAVRFLAFAERLGFNGIQLGPQGQTSVDNRSPYDASIFARDFLSISLAQLVDDGLLSPDTLAALAGDRPPNDRHSHHRHAWHATSGALAEAWHRFVPPSDFETFRAEAEPWLRHRAVPDFDRHLFEQYLVWKQHRRLRAAFPRLRIYGDMQIGMSPEDVEILRTLFLPGYAMGAPPSRTNPLGQPWGYPVFHPGKRADVVAFLRRRVQRMLRAYDGIRIDHPHGHVCPWVYTVAPLARSGDVAAGTRLHASPDLPALAPFAIPRADQLDRSVPRHADNWVRQLDDDQVARYAELFDIVVDEVRAAGGPADDVVCEVLSTLPYPLARVMARHQLGRFRVVQKLSLDRPEDVYRIERAQPEDWIMAGNHDTPPVWALLDAWRGGSRWSKWGAYLAGLLAPPSEREALAGRLCADPGEMVHGLYAAIFASRARHVYIFFPDLLGMTESFNVPGVVDDHNWTLRIPSDFEAAYARAAAAGRALDVGRCLRWAASVSETRRHPARRARPELT